MKTVIFVVCHGIETKLKKASYADSFVFGIRNSLPEGIPFASYQFNWDTIVVEREQKTYEMVKDLRRPLLRKLTCFLGCDILWYAFTKRLVSQGSIYDQIHSKLRREVKQLLALYGKDAVLVLCGHSWGSQIMLDFCFDEDAEITSKIAGLVTMGSPIIYKSGQYDDWGHPPKGLKFWLNFYNPWDPVSTIISRNENFKDAVKDVCVGAWNPLGWVSILMAHTCYWKSGTVKKQIAEAVSAL